MDRGVYKNCYQFYFHALAHFKFLKIKYELYSALFNRNEKLDFYLKLEIQKIYVTKKLQLLLTNFNILGSSVSKFITLYVYHLCLFWMELHPEKGAFLKFLKGY